MVPDASSTARPPRPNSIEVKRNYSSGYGGEDIYATQRNNTARSPQDNTYRSVHLYHSPILTIISIYFGFYHFFKKILNVLNRCLLDRI